MKTGEELLDFYEKSLKEINPDLDNMKKVRKALATSPLLASQVGNLDSLFRNIVELSNELIDSQTVDSEFSKINPVPIIKSKDLQNRYDSLQEESSSLRASISSIIYRLEDIDENFKQVEAYVNHVEKLYDTDDNSVEHIENLENCLNQPHETAAEQLEQLYDINQGIVMYNKIQQLYNTQSYNLSFLGTNTTQ